MNPSQVDLFLSAAKADLDLMEDSYIPLCFSELIFTSIPFTYSIRIRGSTILKMTSERRVPSSVAKPVIITIAVTILKSRA